MRRAARWVGAAVLACVAVTALVVGSAFTLLRTRWGGELVRRVAMPRVNAAIAGHLQLEAFAFGGDHLTLTGVELRDPEGAVVARVRRIAIAFRPLPLLRGRVTIGRAEIVGPSLFLRGDARGLNLTRALAPAGDKARAGSEPAAPGSSRLVLDVAELRVSDGSVELSSGDAPATRATSIAVAARAHYEAGPGAFAVDVRTQADLLHPTRAPVALRLVGRGRRESVDATVTATVGDSSLAAMLRTRGQERVTARLSRAHLAPQIVRAFLPDVPLRIPLDVTATVEREGDAVTLTTAIDGAAGAVKARAALDIAASRARDISVEVQDLDLGRLLEGLPRSRLSLTAVGDGRGHGLDDLTGALTVTMPAGRLAGAPLGPAALRVAAARGRIELTELRLAAPGLAVRGQGELARERVALKLTIEAPDLARTSAVVSSFRGLHAPPFSGSGTVELSIEGSRSAPDVALKAAFPRLHLAGRALRDVSVFARSTPRRLTVDARAGGPAPLALTIAGRWLHRLDSLEVDALQLRVPEATWTQQGPVRLTFRVDHLALKGLALRAGQQRIRADLDKKGDRIGARLDLERIDLAALPPLAFSAPPSLAGRLDVHAEVDGTVTRPVGRAAVTLRGGRFGRYHDLSLQLDGRYGKGRASGDVTASGLGTSLCARFALPVAWPPRERAPIDLALAIAPTDLARVGDALGLPLARRVSGQVGLSLDAHGAAGDPDVALAASAQGLVVDGQPLGDVSLRVSGAPDKPLAAHLEVHGEPAARGAGRRPVICEGSLDMRAGLGLASIVRAPPTLAQLARTRLDVSGDLRGIPLAVLGRWAGSPLVSGGTGSLRVSATGTAMEPTGALNVEVAGATGPRFPPTDARLDAAFGASDTRVALRVLRRERVLASASGILRARPRDLADVAALAGAPLTLRAALGPLALRRTELEGAEALGLPQSFSASLRAALEVDGTLERPTLKVTADLSDARLGAQALGRAHALVTYSSHHADADVQLDSAKGGQLRLTAGGAVDLGSRAVLHGLDVRRLPFEAKLTAHKFDLSWLSGASRSIRHVGGELAATLAASGTVAKPAVTGQLEWVNGSMTSTMLGEYRDVHLRARADERSLRIEELRLASGEGNGHLTASATRQPDGSYELTSALSLKQFPIYGQGQPLAVLSIDGRLTGTASASSAKASFDIADAHVELSEIKKRDLQPLGRPADVILFERGQPIDGAEAAKLAALAPALGGKAHASGPSSSSAAAKGPRSLPYGIDVAVEAPRNLWVKGKDASLELGLSQNFRVSVAGPPRITGEVVVRRGRIDVLGRRFDLEAGSVVDFDGPPESPRLDVRAKHVNETEGITVLLSAKGPLDKLTIIVSSPNRPDLTTGQLYTLIATGRLQLGGDTAGSATASNQAASIVGGLLASQLQQTLAKRLPLDVLSIQAGQGLAGSRLEAGTYLTSKLYAGYVGRVGANPALLQNRNAVRIEYQLSRRWSFDGEYGDVGTGTADLIWTKSY